MPQPTSTVDLGRLSLSFGEAASLQVPVRGLTLELGGQTYSARPALIDTALDVSRTNAGYAMRLRLQVGLEGPCQRCLDEAAVEVEVEAREVDHPGPADEELRSPYVDAGELDVGRWAHDAVALAIPGQILCRPTCAGLCAVCGESLNDANPADHAHEQGGDPRWAKLRELRLK